MNVGGWELAGRTRGPVASVVTRGVPAVIVPTAAFHGKNRTTELHMQLEAPPDTHNSVKQHHNK